MTSGDLLRGMTRTARTSSGCSSSNPRSAFATRPAAPPPTAGFASAPRLLVTADPIDPTRVLAVLERHRVRYVLIGGVAANVHGYPLPTEDVDITPAPDAENLERLAEALRELNAELRVVVRPDGTGGYDDLRRDASREELAEGLSVHVASLADVIRSKEAAGRPKDQAQMPALRETLELRRRRERE